MAPERHDNHKLPRANLKQKIDVLDFFRGPPQRSQAQVLKHFQNLKMFSISQATLSSWCLNETQLRKNFNENPNLSMYKKKPVLKYPEVTKLVESYIDENVAKGVIITDQLIKDCFNYYLGIYGYAKESVLLSSGMLHSFKKRNSIKKGLKIDKNLAEQLATAEPTPVPVPVPAPVSTTTSETTPVSAPVSEPVPVSVPVSVPAPVPPQAAAAPPQAQALAVATPSESPSDQAQIPLQVSTASTAHIPPFPHPTHIQSILENSALGFNTRLIHSDDSNSNFFNNYGNRTVDPVTTEFNALAHSGLMASDNLALNDDNSNNKQQQQQQQQQQQRHQRQQSRQNTGNSNTPINTNIILDNFSYSRTSHPNSEKVEKILENITNGYVTLYNSGTSAIMGLLTYLNPNKICINNNGGYQGTHQVIKLLSKLTHLEKLSLNEYNKLRKGDVMLIESPMNPEGYCVDIEKYSKLAHSKNALLLVDSTLAPPPLQDPFKHGADYIIHSATKYFSGHSDLLAGFIVSSTKDTKINLLEERFSLGTNIANFDSFLLLRSLRTFKMRILQQSSNTFQLIKFLMKNISKYPIITKIHHSSLQLDPFVLLQLNGYYNPIFAIEFKSMEIAELLINRFSFLNCKNNLTGGGVETTVELTYKNPNFVNLDFDNINSSVGANLLRFSVGCEDHEDLINDFDQALSSFNT